MSTNLQNESSFPYRKSIFSKLPNKLPEHQNTRDNVANRIIGNPLSAAYIPTGSIQMKTELIRFLSTFCLVYRVTV